MAQILQPGSAYPEANYTEFFGFSSTGENYKKPKEFATSIPNSEITHENKLVKARGYRSLGSWRSNRIREILQYRNDTKDVLLLFGSDGLGTSAAICEVSSQWTSAIAFNEILTGIDVATEANIIQFGNNAYLFNGNNDQWYDGTTWRPIGAAAPVGAATLNTTIPGSMNTSSGYYVAWRWYDPINNRRTNLSPVSALMTTGAGPSTAGLRITLPGETPPAGFSSIQVMVTLAFNTQLFVDQVVSAATTSVDITASDAVRAVNEIDEGNLDNAPYRKYDLVVVANNKIYGARSDDSTCRVERSRVSSQVGALPQSWSPKFFTDCTPSASDKIVGLGVCGTQEAQTVIVIKQRSFGKIVSTATNVEEYQKLGDIPGHGHKSVFQLGVYCGWMNETNCYLTDGTGYIEIGGGEKGREIVDTFRGLSQNQKVRCNAVHVQRSKQIRLSVVAAGQAWPTAVLMGHYENLENIGMVKWTSREQGPNVTTWPGVQAASMKVVLDNNNEEQTLFGNSNANGKLYQWDYGVNDDGSYIYARWAFRPECFGDLKNEKMFSDIHVRMRTADATTTVNFGLQLDLQGAIQPLGSQIISGSGFVLGESRLGITPFSNSPIGQMIVPCQKRAKLAAFVVYETTDKTIELLDYTMTGIV